MGGSARGIGGRARDGGGFPRMRHLMAGDRQGREGLSPIIVPTRRRDHFPRAPVPGEG